MSPRLCIVICVSILVAVRALILFIVNRYERNTWKRAYRLLAKKVYQATPDQLDDLEEQVDTFFERWYGAAPRQVTEATCHLMERLYERRRIVGPSNPPTLPAF